MTGPRSSCIDIDTVFPELQDRHEFCERIVSDLTTRFLYRPGMVSTGPSLIELPLEIVEQTTDLGNKLLEFVTFDWDSVV